MAVASPETVTDMSAMNTEAVAADAQVYIDYILDSCQPNAGMLPVLHALRDSLDTCVDVVP